MLRVMEREDLRQQIATALLDEPGRAGAAAAAVIQHAGDEALDAESGRRIALLLVRLLAFVVRDGRLVAHGGLLAELQQIVESRGLSADQLFSFVYLVEREVLDDLAVHDAIGATTEPWAAIAQLVRRGSFDLLAAYVDRTRADARGAGLIDPLTTLTTRAMFEVVLAKEVERASRFGYAIALILFDVDRLSAINERHGYGVGDRILERLGIVIRKYFRQHDWVARHADDAIAVLLTQSDAEHANELAEHVRETVAGRLTFTDRGDEPVQVTVSAGVVHVEGNSGAVADPERLMACADAAVGRAKQHGRNRVEAVSGASATRTLPRSSPSA